METLFIQVSYDTALHVPKIERVLTKNGEVITKTYLNQPDCNGYWAPHIATYLVITKDSINIRRALTQIKTHSKITIKVVTQRHKKPRRKRIKTPKESRI